MKGCRKREGFLQLTDLQKSSPRSYQSAALPTELRQLSVTQPETPIAGGNSKESAGGDAIGVGGDLWWVGAAAAFYCGHQCPYLQLRYGFNHLSACLSASRTRSPWPSGTSIKCKPQPGKKSLSISSTRGPEGSESTVIARYPLLSCSIHSP